MKVAQISFFVNNCYYWKFESISCDRIYTFTFLGIIQIHTRTLTHTHTHTHTRTNTHTHIHILHSTCLNRINKLYSLQYVISNISLIVTYLNAAAKTEDVKRPGNPWKLPNISITYSKIICIYQDNNESH